MALIDERGKYKVRDLAVMHENMKEIIQKLEKSNDDKKSVLEEENNRLTENIKNIFKKKF